MTIWGGITASHVTGPYFFDETVNAISYPEKWNYIVADLSNRGSIEQVWFLQHGAPAYFTLTVNEVLNEALPCWWIGHGSATSASPKSWPSHIPDLTAPDYSLWGIIDKMAGYHCNTTYAWKVSQKDVLTHQAVLKKTAPINICWIHKMQVWWNK